MPDLSVTVAGIEMKNPVTVGSGTYGHHGRFSQFFPVETLGLLVPKTIRAYRWPGNPPPRVLEVPAGLHSSVGIPCNDWETWVATDVPILRSLKLPIVQSVIGRTEDDYVEIAERVDALGLFDGIELNMSCPNIAQGGLDFGYDPVAAASLVRRVKDVVKVPVFAKLAPDFSSLEAVAKAIEDAGADAISLINAPRAICIDPMTGLPMAGNKIGSLSGTAIKPMAVYMTWQLYRAVNIPLVGMGGVTDWRDVIEFMAAGARAVAFGTISYVDPMAPANAIPKVAAFLEEHGIDDVNDLVGMAHEDGLEGVKARLAATRTEVPAD